MSRILFVVGSERGRLNPLIGPAYQLQQLGHTVAFFTPYNASKQLKRAGFNISYSEKPGAMPVATASQSQLFTERLKDSVSLKQALRSDYLDGVIQRVTALKGIAEEFQPEIMAVDPKSYEGAIVAEQKKIPWATLSASLSMVTPEYMQTDLGEAAKAFDRQRSSMFDLFGVVGKFRFAGCLSPRLNLCFTTDALIGSAGPPEVKRIGPALLTGDRGDECDFPWEQINDKVPVVYVWLGSRTYHQLHALRTLMSAVKGKDIQLICAASALADSLEYTQPNVMVVREAPQLNILPVVSAHVTHGGAASVMESIALGVPMLISPIYDDHSHQAYFIDKCGAGQRQDLSKLDADACWKALQSVLQSPRIKETIQNLKLSYKKYDGSSEAARLIEKLA